MFNFVRCNNVLRFVTYENSGKYSSKFLTAGSLDIQAVCDMIGGKRLQFTFNATSFGLIGFISNCHGTGADRYLQAN